MNRFIRKFAGMALGAAVMALAVSTNANAQKKYTFGYDQPHTTAYGIAADMFNAKLMELSWARWASTSSRARSSAKSR